MTTQLAQRIAHATAQCIQDYDGKDYLAYFDGRKDKHFVFGSNYSLKHYVSEIMEWSKGVLMLSFSGYKDRQEVAPNTCFVYLAMTDENLSEVNIDYAIAINIDNDVVVLDANEILMIEEILSLHLRVCDEDGDEVTLSYFDMELDREFEQDIL